MHPVDWQLWFAYMDPVPANMTIEFADEDHREIQLAYHFLGPRHGLQSASEFVEMVLWERCLTLDLADYIDYIESTTGPQPCFFCGNLTTRVDLDFQAPYCGSGVCEWAIGEDLRMMETARSR